MNSGKEVKFSLNARPVSLDVAAGETLFETLGRLGLRLRSACDEQGICGACAVLVDGQPVNSCLYLAVRVEGRCVRTIEGESLNEGGLSPMQKAYLKAGAVQCGFCTPALVLTSTAFVEQNKHRAAKVGRQEIIRAHQGHLCRCTGYQQIIDAVELALKEAASLTSGRAESSPRIIRGKIS